MRELTENELVIISAGVDAEGVLLVGGATAVMVCLYFWSPPVAVGIVAVAALLGTRQG